MQSNRPAMRIQHRMTKKSKKQIVPQEDDKNYQSTKYFESKIYSDKKCQEKSANTWPVEPQMDMWPKEPAIQSSFKKKYVPLSKDNNCKSTRMYKKSMCSDKN